jgi:hypothetical protein
VSYVGFDLLHLLAQIALVAFLITIGPGVILMAGQWLRERRHRNREPHS